MTIDLCERWRTHRDQYTYRAYMSSGLTNLSDDQASKLRRMLEGLYLDVFEPLRVFLYLPHLWSNPGHDSDMSPEDVHTLDRLRIAESDFLVLCADYPSFGAGQEFEIAQALGLPILVFHRAETNGRETKVSRMLTGGPCIHLPPGKSKPSHSLIVYRDWKDLRRQLRDRIANLLASLPRSQPVPLEAEFPRKLAELVSRRGLTAADVARETRLPLPFVEFLTSSHDSVKGVLQKWELPDFDVPLALTKFTNPGLWVVQRLCAAFQIEPQELLDRKMISTEDAQGETIRNQIRKEARILEFGEELIDRFLEQEEDVKELAARSSSEEIRQALKRFKKRQEMSRQEDLF